LKHLFVLTTLAVVLGGSGARAAVITLNVNGILEDSSSVITDITGTIMVDNVAGMVTSGSLTLSAPNAGVYSVLCPGQQADGDEWVVGFGMVGETVGGYPGLTILFPGTTLVGYSGGPLCSVQAPCNGYNVSGLLRYAGDEGTGPHLTQGTASPGVPTSGAPEPRSLAMIGVGLVGLAARSRIQKLLQ
jgi:hypothetical protein